MHRRDESPTESMIHLLDSDSVIDALKGIRSCLDLLQELVSAGHILAINDVVLCEVYAGLHPKDESAALAFLDSLTYLPTSEAAARQAGRWEYQYARQGMTLSHTDCLIAACAQAQPASLVTGNAKDFPMAAAGAVTIVPLPRPSHPGR